MTGKESIRLVAAMHGKSERTIRREIQRAIDEAMKSRDPKIRGIWAAIPCKGEKPTPEEVIEWAAAQARM